MNSSKANIFLFNQDSLKLKIGSNSNLYNHRIYRVIWRKKIKKTSHMGFLLISDAFSFKLTCIAQLIQLLVKFLNDIV
jgi:hypothetical protein